MKVKEIYVEAALSRSFQKYTVGYVVEVNENDDKDVTVRALQAKCRKLAQEQIAIDKGV